MLQQLAALCSSIVWLVWLVWIAGIADIALRALPKQRAYPRQFAWFDRTKALWQRQADPEVEQLRRALWRLYGYGALWELGFPLLAVGALKLVAFTGLLQTPSSGPTC
jgi:hypothetical protein